MSSTKRPLYTYSFQRWLAAVVYLQIEVQLVCGDLSSNQSSPRLLKMAERNGFAEDAGLNSLNRVLQPLSAADKRDIVLEQSKAPSETRLPVEQKPSSIPKRRYSGSIVHMLCATPTFMLLIDKREAAVSLTTPANWLNDRVCKGNFT